MSRIPWLARAYRWGGWQWISFAAPWLLLGLVLGAITIGIIHAIIP